MAWTQCTCLLKGRGFCAELLRKISENFYHILLDLVQPILHYPGMAMRHLVSFLSHLAF